MASHSPEHHRQHHIGRRSGHHQDPSIHIGIKNAVNHWHTASGQQSQAQNTARHSAGDSEEQENQPQKLLLPAIGRQAHQHTRRQLNRCLGEKPPPRQEYRRRVSASQEGGQKTAAPSQRQARQPGGSQEQEVIHQPVQEKNAVYVNYRHAASPPPEPASRGTGLPLI